MTPVQEASSSKPKRLNRQDDGINNRAHLLDLTHGECTLGSLFAYVFVGQENRLYMPGQGLILADRIFILDLLRMAEVGFCHI